MENGAEGLTLGQSCNILNVQTSPRVTGDVGTSEEDIMTKYWVISPHHLAKPEWEKAWQYDLSHGTIAIGWRELGDVSSYDRDQLEKAIKERWPDAKPIFRTFPIE